MSTLLKDLENCVETCNSDNIFQSLDPIIVEYKSQSKELDIDERLECLKKNTMFLLKQKSRVHHNGSLDHSQDFDSRDISIYSAGYKNIRKRNRAKVSISLINEATNKLKLRDRKGSEGEIFNVSKCPYDIKGPELTKKSSQGYLDINSFCSGDLREVSIRSKNTDSSAYDSIAVESTLVHKEALEQRMRKEIKILRDENIQLKIQAEKMKVFVPVSLLPKSDSKMSLQKKSWEMTAKVLKKGGKVKLSQKFKYIESCIQELVERHHALKTYALKILQNKCEENKRLEDDIDALYAKIDGYESEIEHMKVVNSKAILSERQIQEKLLEVTKSKETMEALLNSNVEFTELQKSISDIFSVSILINLKGSMGSDTHDVSFSSRS